MSGSPDVIVVDGGLSNALEERGHDVSGALWTARLLRDAPDEVAAVHRDYYLAGARVATTASYQASVPGFVAAGMDEDRARALVGHSVTVAREVRDALAGDGVRRWVAASVGPYGAVLADGSEYRGRYGLTRAQLRDFHGPRLELLVAAAPDLLAVETIPDLDEAAVVADLVEQLGMPAWVSFTVSGSRTCAGQPLAEAFAIASAASTVVAVGVNCCAPSDVLPALVTAAEVTDKPLVAYPNSGARWDAWSRRWVGGAAYDVGLAHQWVGAGARYVGGCCRVGVRDIAALAASLSSASP